MRRLAGLGAALALIATVPATPGAAGGGVALNSARPRYVPGAEVVLALRNRSDRAVAIEGPLRIRSVREERVVARVDHGATRVRPGETVQWRWDQRSGRCTSPCARPGATVPAGPYRAVVPTSAGRRRAAFELGQFFTLGFSSSEDEFVVFVRKQPEIDEMTAEAGREDKTLITSGIVRRGAPYNPRWSYTMGPGSIVLGEVFTEACDANPHHVERNRRRWLGHRWCPWSSYVKRVGR